MLHVDRLAVGYHGVHVVEHINLRLSRGEVTALIGPVAGPSFTGETVHHIIFQDVRSQLLPRRQD